METGPSTGKAKQLNAVDFTEPMAEYKKLGQDHIFKWTNDMAEEERKRLLEQIKTFDLEKVLRDFKEAKEGAGTATKRLQPSPLTTDDVILPTEESKRAFWEVGINAIRENKVAIVTLAGGQGTRLGSAEPKGCYDIGLASGMSLFEIQALRLRRLAELAQVEHIPWYIMTSDATDEATVAFFKQHKYFGIKEKYVTFFKQGQLPALSEEGKLILKERSSLALSPNGNGGIYDALLKEKILEDMRKQKIEFVHMYCVDNALVRVGDPYFIGACISKDADCAAKSIPKVDPNESVGVFCRRNDGKLVVAEYSEIDSHIASQTDKENILILNQANIANHFFTISFLEKVASNGSLPTHLAHKKIQSIDDQGQKNDPPRMGFKLEYFIFDVFEQAERPLIYQGNRNEEFAPLKNAPGSASDAPEHCRQMLLDLHSRWLQDNGAQFSPPIEVSPLVSYSGESLQEYRGKKIERYLTK